MFYYFFNNRDIFIFNNSRLLTNKSTDVVTERYFFTVKHFKIRMTFFYFADQNFSVLNKTPSDTLKVHEKCVLYQFIIFIWNILGCCQKYNFFLKSNLKFELVRVSCGRVFFAHPLVFLLNLKSSLCLHW